VKIQLFTLNGKIRSFSLDLFSLFWMHGLGESNLAQVCGCFMPLMGFMVVPSKFPKWLRWANVVPFHTYAWQSLMFNEFSGDESGHNVLELYEIEDVDVGRGMVVLLGYSLVIHFFSIVTLILKNPRRMSRKLKAS